MTFVSLLLYTAFFRLCVCNFTESNKSMEKGTGHRAEGFKGLISILDFRFGILD
jgi:hypothetical protein